MPLWSLPGHCAFPHPLTADRSGILATGGDLSILRLLLAYAYGIFPWYAEDEPILWWFPDPRCVMRPQDAIVTKSMRALLRKAPFTITCDTDFPAVIAHCRSIARPGQPGTWIQPEMVEAYLALHAAGYAHSMEVWDGDRLAGGLYGVAMGNVFFGESMFSVLPSASKYAFIKLARFLLTKGFTLIDCQQDTQHMRSLGASLVPARTFHGLLAENRRLPARPGKWVYSESPLPLDPS